jgi:predicted dienelactone hydrolase
MTEVLSAGPPIEPQRCAVGRTSTVLVDSARGDRVLPVDCWYPTLDGTHPESRYELLPGIAFTASAFADAPAAPGPHPLVVWSHGRTGTRSSYAMLCEALAARGYVVVAPDHPGDTLADWILGVAVDDATNERQRVDDVRCVLDAVLGNRAGPALNDIDAEHVAVAGHSYGAYTAFALAGADPTDGRIRAVAGLQSFTRGLAPSVLARVTIPSLFVAGARDTTTPAETDTGPAFAAVASRDARRVDIDNAGHQASSDVGLYLELAPQVEALPDLVADYLRSLADQVTGRAGDPWRPTVGLHVRILGAWLDEVFDRNVDEARRDLEAVRRTAGVTMQTADAAR